MRACFNIWLMLALSACHGLGDPLATTTNAPLALPPIPLLPSPVKVLRELLVQPAAERSQRLGMYPDGLREPLAAKVNEYLALPAEVREWRLQATDLRHYLLQLMPLDASARRAALAQVPESIREAVAARLDHWQLLPPPMQEELLENEQVVRYFTQIGITSEELRKGLLDVTPPDQRLQMKAGIARWEALPEETRRRVFAQFNQMFDLTAEEQARSLRALSEAEREAMTDTLALFESLPPEKRAICVRSFEKFSRMSAVERRQFLQKAEAWERMTAEEREQWRELVSRVPDLPPLPPGLVPRLSVPTVVPTTNGG